MELVGQYFIQYFALILLALVVISNAAVHYYTNRRISLCTIGISVCCIILSISYYVQEILKPKGNAYLYPVLILSIIGYCLRPLCLYLFISMNKKAYVGKWSFLMWLPLVINAIIYLCALIPGTSEIIFGFSENDIGTLIFSGGPLRFACHIISMLYLLYLVYISIFTLQSKHIFHGITVLGCAIFVAIATVIETFFNPDGKIELINITIMISTITYYLFLYKENMQVDSLTGLFNRETYYRDINRMNKTFSGVIQFDINGLKYINDHFGHLEGDKCISSIAKMIEKSINRKMYAYRMGGDEFLVIANNASEMEITNAIIKFKDALNDTEYHCSVGYAIKYKDASIKDAIKEAEKNMYLDKEDFYKNSKFERRKI